MSGSVHKTAAIGFSKQVENYEKARPSYREDVFQRVLDEFQINANEIQENINVLDLAAGTGKFTRLLENFKKFNVYAVEPSKEMRDGFSKCLPQIPIYDGTSTSIPFEDGFFQIVFVAQAFHWFSNIESIREIHRVLKPQKDVKHGKSGLVLIWNMEDRDEPYIAEIRDIYEYYDAGAPQYRKDEWKIVLDKTPETFNYFLPREIVFFKSKGETYLPLSHVWLRALSKSYIASLDKSEQEIVKKKIENVLEKYKDRFVKREGIDEMYIHYPYNTELTWMFVKP